MPAVSGLHYFAHSSEKKPSNQPAIVLIHGAGGNYSSWPPHIRRLPEHHVFALDLPGHGNSEGVGRQSIEEYAQDVIAFVDSLQLRSVVLAGISMGSAIAMVLALQRPKGIAGLVLLGSGSRLRVAPQIIEALANSTTFEMAVDDINNNCFSAGVSPKIKQLSREIMLGTRQTVMQGDFLACDRFDVTERLRDIRIPTLIVCGSEDRMTPVKYSQFLGEAIKGAQLHIVEGAGHMVMAEHPQVVADLVAQFTGHLKRRTRGVRKGKTGG